MTRRRRLIVGNWKMHGSSASLVEARQIAEGAPLNGPRVALCPPAVLAHRLREATLGTPLIVGAQDVHWASRGAHTGDHSADLLADAGVRLVILGHSERRQAYAEAGALVARKALAAAAAGLEPVICVGESAEADGREAAAAAAAQLEASLPVEIDAPLAVAYEPVWAIGSGRRPSPSAVREVHARLRDVLAERLGPDAAGRTPILYGGSVTPRSAPDLLRTPEVDGLLVGGASHRAADFLAIVRHAA